MARYKPYDYTQTKLLPVHFDRQLLPGTCEYTLHSLIDEKIDLSVFAARGKNDEGGAPAYAPAMLWTAWCRTSSSFSATDVWRSGGQ